MHFLYMCDSQRLKAIFPAGVKYTPHNLYKDKKS